MHKLEDNRLDSASASHQANQRNKKSSINAVGVAATFERQELKSFFVNYLTTMLVIEGLIFFFCFVNHLATESPEFPWKNYLFATFIAPIVITFVFGLIILTFNKYFFKGAVEAPDPNGAAYAASNSGKGDRLDSFFQVVHRLPFLLSLLLLIAATAIAYKMDDIVLYAAQAGAATAQYLFITLVAVMAAGSLAIFVWMFLSYRLRQNALKTSHQYKMQLMDQFGMVQLDDGTMLNKQGEIVYQQNGSATLSYEDLDENVQLIEEVKKDS